MKEQEMRDAAARFWQQQFFSAWRQDIGRYFQSIKTKGNFTALLTSAPQFLVEPLSLHVSFDAVLATEYATDLQGRFCRISKIVDGRQKALFLQNIIKGLSICPQKTWAYSDSLHDLPFLEAAVHPTVVYPDKALRAIALARKWRIFPPLPKCQEN